MLVVMVTMFMVVMVLLVRVIDNYGGESAVGECDNVYGGASAVGDGDNVYGGDGN